jgi:hypothetical protein
LAAILSVGVKTYHVWTDGPWELPAVEEVTSATDAKTEAKVTRPAELVNTKVITEKNLFDPERGMSKDKADEALAMTTQKIRALLLVGTVILGESRYAIIEDPGDPRLWSPRPELQPIQRGEMRRLRLGDSVDGFRLADVKDRSVTFVNGNSKVELALDYFRKFKDGRPRGLTSAPAGSAGSELPATPLVPRFPRRDAGRG